MFCKIVVKLFITDRIIKYIINGVSALPIQIIASIILYICYFSRGNSYMRLRIYIEQCIFLFFVCFCLFGALGDITFYVFSINIRILQF